jgi:hypothetical protein
MNTPFENNTIYTINDRFYLNINGTTAINLSDDLKQYKAKYPNIEDNKLGLFIEINENEIGRITSNTDRYSSVDDQTPIGRFAKNASLVISRAVRHGQPAAQNVHKALALPEFAGRFNLIRHNLYTDTGRQEARSVGISDAPTAYCNGDILRGVQSDYTIRKYLRKLLG